MTYLTERITPAPQLWKPRIKPVRLIFVHATRGGTASSAIDYRATKNWFQSPNNNAGVTWGGCASRIIGPAGQHCIVLDDDRYPTYSGCYGYLGHPAEFCVDEYAISYEVAQPTNDTPFTDAQYDRLAIEVAADCRRYSIPPVMLSLLPAQYYPVPTGITRHDRTANGKKLGKSDPGKMFDEARFLALLSSYLNDEEGDMDEATLSRIIDERLDAYFASSGSPGQGKHYGDRRFSDWLHRMMDVKIAALSVGAGPTAQQIADEIAKRLKD